MIREIVHVGVTVSDMDRSIAFYRDVMGLRFDGEVTMQGRETDRLFQGENIVARVAYLNGSEHVKCPPVELICFENGCDRMSSALTRCGISEICFVVDNIDLEYQRMRALGVDFLSAPQYFDFRESGMGESKAVYFRDPDGIIMELMQYL